MKIIRKTITVNKEIAENAVEKSRKNGISTLSGLIQYLLAQYINKK
jgi:hypothetical protein